MGVLNFNSTFHQSSRRNAHPVDVINFEAHQTTGEIDQEPPVVVDSSNDRRGDLNHRNNKRKRIKSGSKPLFNLDIDEGANRKSGSKHQRRKQHYHELQELAGCTGVDDEMSMIENQMTAFAELFLDDDKMKLWERFISLSEDNQDHYMDKLVKQRVSTTHGENFSNIAPGSNDQHYSSIDKKIRDLLKSKQLSDDVNGLLKYYEDDLKNCLEILSVPATIVLKIDDGYDRMLVYAVCQYMKLATSTIKVQSSTLIEIDLDVHGFPSPTVLLSEYLKQNLLKLR